MNLRDYYLVIMTPVSPDLCSAVYYNAKSGWCNKDYVSKSLMLMHSSLMPRHKASSFSLEITTVH